MPAPRGERGHQPRVDAAREEHAERHVAGHARAHRLGERLARGVGQHVVAHARRGVHAVPRAPVALQPLAVRRDLEHVRGRQLPQRGEGAVVAGEEAVHEVARERRRRGLARDPGQRQQRAGLRGEGEARASPSAAV